ncbi:MAG: GDSL-type esterase/lipase family protein [Patescibacteria group bacterium]
MRILVFGDSITYGVWDREGGWAQRLRKFLDEKTLIEQDFYCLVYNLGISGDTSEDLLERFEFETKQRIKEKEDTVIIFSIGGNDATFIDNRNQYQISQDRFKENIQKLIKLAEKYASKILFVGLLPADESKTIPIPWAPDKSYKNEHIVQYDKIIKSICRGNEIPFIDVFEEFINSDYKNLLEDGQHPNSAGHQKIFEIVKEFLIANKVI